MNKKLIIGLAITAFLVGDAEAVVRLNKKIKRADKQFALVKLHLDARQKVLDEMAKGVSAEVAMHHYVEALKFLDIVAQEL